MLLGHEILVSQIGYDAAAKEEREIVDGSPFAPLLPIRPSNTRDQLRGAHDLTLVHDERSDKGAAICLQPPLVSCIALFDSAPQPYWSLLSSLAENCWMTSGD